MRFAEFPYAILHTARAQSSRCSRNLKKRRARGQRKCQPEDFIVTPSRARYFYYARLMHTNASPITTLFTRLRVYYAIVIFQTVSSISVFFFLRNSFPLAKILFLRKETEIYSRLSHSDIQLHQRRGFLSRRFTSAVFRLRAGESETSTCYRISELLS